MSSTPILDLWQDPPAPRTSKWTALIWLAVVVAIWFVPTFVPTTFGESLPGVSLLFIPCFYIAIAIHELGHLIAGKIAGMAPGGLVIGGFVMMKSGDHWTFRFDYRRALSGGMAIPQPARGDFRVAPFVWMVAAGPIASILCTLICTIAFLKYGTGTWDWIGSFFWASVVGLTSLIPMSVGLHKSDAARVWMLLKQPGEARAWMAAIAIQAEDANGVLPRDWDAVLVDQMLTVSQPGGARIFADLRAYYRRLNEGNESAALEHLENALRESAKSGKVVRQVLFFEAAEVNALMTRNATKARTWLDRGLKLRKPESRRCVDGSIAMCEGRYDDALRDIAATRAFIVKRKLDSGLARFAHERLNDRERRCEEALRALSSDRAKASVSA